MSITFNFPSVEDLNKFFEKNTDSKKTTDCIIERAMKQEIADGVPEHRRTKAWFISCPCKKCSPFTL